MKKFLSLVLALVMTMSLVTMAGADFTDAADVDYAEAVEVLTATGIVSGYTDGSVRPDVALNRGQAAKIICNLILGPTASAALPTGVAPYADVPAGSTFAGYIAYLSKEGVVSGYADGNFKPTAPLTGYAFMKMLLGVLGYDAAIEGYTGSNWAVAVAKQALAVGLDDDLAEAFVGTKTVTRQEAMLYAFNALKADFVTYADKGANITIGGVTINTGASEAREQYDYYQKLFDGDLYYTTGLDATGRPSITWTFDGDKVGTFADKPVAVYTKAVKEKAVYADAGIDKTNAYVFTSTVNEETAQTPGTCQIRKYNETTVAGSGDGVVTEFYLNKDENQGYMVQVHPVISKVTSVGKDADGDRVIRVDGKTYETEKFAKNDYVIYTTKWDATAGAMVINTIALAEKQTGTVTLLKGSDEVYIDGVKYILSDSTGAELVSVGVEDIVDYYLDAQGNIIKIAVAAANINLDNLAFVEKAGLSSDVYDTIYKATLRKADGSKVVVETDVDYAGAYKVATFKVNKDGKTELKGDAKFYYANTSFVKGNPALDGKVANANTKFVYVLTNDGKTEVTVYDGYKAAPSITSANIGYYAKDGKVILAFVYAAKSALDTTSSDATFVIFNKNSKVVDDGDSALYYEMPTITNGKIGTVKLAKTEWDTVAAYKVSGYTNLTLDTDNVATLGSDLARSTYVGTQDAEIKAVDAETITINGLTKAWDEDVKVYFVDADLNIREGAVDEIYEGTVGTTTSDSYTGVWYTVDKDKAHSIETIILCEK